MTVEAVTEQLKTLIAQELDVNLREDEMDAGAPLFEDGLGIDSIAIVELISVTERHFGIEFADEDLVPESFASLRVLADLIVRKMGAAVGGHGHA